MYKVVDRATNNWIIDEFTTKKEAEKEIEKQEKEDKKNGNYEENFYQII